MTDLINKKKELRKSILAKRAAMTPDAHALANQRIFQGLTSLAEYKDAETLFIYVSVTDEPDTLALIEDALKRGKRVCVPRCVSLGVMEACVIDGMHDLQEGYYNIPEPKPHCITVEHHEIDLAIVPCVCCTPDGYRLGYGGGFYDRWLKDLRAPAAVLCFEEILVPTLPCEPHDERLNILVSNAAHSVTRF